MGTFSCKLCPVVCDDGVRDPKVVDYIYEEVHGLFGSDFHNWPCLKPFLELVDRNERVSMTPRCLFKGAPFG